MQVDPETFGRIVGSALTGVGIGLSYTPDSSGALVVTSVECPFDAFSIKAAFNVLSIRMLQLSRKQSEIQQLNDSKHDAVLIQLRNMRRDIVRVAQHLHAPLDLTVAELDEAPRHTDVRSLAPDGQRQAVGNGE